MIGYLVYFNLTKAKDIVNSPYNKRQELLSKRVIRGDIQDASGNVLAGSTVQEDGSVLRTYPYGDLFAHVVGYSTKDAGNTGLEASENFPLLTSDTFFAEKIKNELQGKPNTGDTIVTSLDTDLQQYAYDALGDNKGAIVIMDSATGKILSLVSKPSFDPNTLLDNWDSLNTDEENTPLINRATQGSYAPGSTFKLVTTLAFMRQNPDYDNYSYNCEGEISGDGITVQCFDHIAHGQEDLRQSLANSCNSSFANIGLQLDRDTYKKTAEDLLFNKTLPDILPYTKSSFTLDKKSPDSEAMITAMGQGKTTVSPYHMALIVQSVANGGTLMNPYLVTEITNHDGQVIKKFVPKSYGKLMEAEEAAVLKSYMQSVVSDGTASLFNGASYTVAGKTGTAEYSLSDGEKTHSWFVGMTNVDNPELIISIIVEGYDGKAESKAVPIAKQILDYYYSR